MANDFGVAGSALYSRLGTAQYTYVSSGTAITTGSVAVYDSLATQGSPAPYVIFQHQAGLDEYTFGTASGVSLDYAVKAVSDRTTPKQAEMMYASAHAALQDAPLSLSGYTLLRCRRSSTFKFRDDKGYWHVGGLYRIDGWQS